MNNSWFAISNGATVEELLQPELDRPAMIWNGVDDIRFQRPNYYTNEALYCRRVAVCPG